MTPYTCIIVTSQRKSPLLLWDQTLDIAASGVTTKHINSTHTIICGNSPTLFNLSDASDIHILVHHKDPDLSSPRDRPYVGLLHIFGDMLTRNTTTRVRGSIGNLLYIVDYLTTSKRLHIRRNDNFGGFQSGGISYVVQYGATIYYRR